MKHGRQRCSINDENGDLLNDVEGVKSIVKKHFEYRFEEPFLNCPTLEGIAFKHISSAYIMII